MKLAQRPAQPAVNGSILHLDPGPERVVDGASCRVATSGYAGGRSDILWDRQRHNSDGRMLDLVSIHALRAGRPIEKDILVQH